LFSFEAVNETVQPFYSGGEAVFGHLARASLVAVAVALLLHVLKLSARARAWHNIVCATCPDEPLRFRHSLGAYLGGIGVNAVLPARPGELLKLVLIRRQASAASYPALASTLVTESVFDSVVAVATFSLVAILGWTPLGSMVASPLNVLVVRPWIGVASLVAAAIVALLAWRLLGKRLRRPAAEARRGLAILGDPTRYLRTVVSWQLVAFVMRLASICFFLEAFHLGASLKVALLVVAVQSVSGLIPVTPGGAGTQQALLVLALGASGTAASAISFGVGAQLSTALADVVLALAALALMTRSMRWRRTLATGQGAGRLLRDPTAE